MINERFTVVPMCYVDETGVYTHELRLNLFQIEGYVSSVLETEDEDGIPTEHDITRIFTKSGYEYDILMPINEFDDLFK